MQGITSSARVQLFLKKPGSITLRDLQTVGNWNVSTILHDYSLTVNPIQVSPDSSGLFTIIIKPDRPIDYTAGAALVRFTSSNGNVEAACKPDKIEASSRIPTFVEDPKDADITITGALQAAVGDKPQYNYSIDGKYDVYSIGAHAIAATFKAIASQEHNADPDSMKLAANYRWIINLPSKWGLILSSDLIAYEFERAIKEDKPVALDQPIPKYIDKNSNRVHSAQVAFIRSTKYGSFFLRPGGIEGGSNITRTVHASSNTYEANGILRGVFGGDYYMFWKPAKALHRIDFEAHHTQRVLHFAEPYVRAELNGGQQFLSRFARPNSTAKLTFTLVDGFGLSFSYLRGSLPPTFEFVNHQVTIGLTVLLKRK